MAIIRRFFTGNTAQNDAYTGPPGKISFDTEKKNVRIHDGTTPGGHEIAEIRDIEEAIRLIDYTEILSGNIDGQEVTKRIDGEFGWKDLISDITIRGNGSSNPEWGIFRNGIHAYMFRNGRTNECWANFHIGHDYAMGTPVYPHVHWSPVTNGSGTVRWGFEYTVAKGHGQTHGSVFAPSTVIYMEHPVVDRQFVHLISETSDVAAIPPDLLEPDSLILLRIFRDGTHANDTFTGNAAVFMVDVHYQAARFSTKNKAPNLFD